MYQPTKCESLVAEGEVLAQVVRSHEGGLGSPALGWVMERLWRTTRPLLQAVLTSHRSAESAADLVSIRINLLVHARLRPAEMLVCNPGRDLNGIEATS